MKISLIKIKKKQFLKHNPRIFILNPDKTNKAIITNTKDYEKKILKGLILILQLKVDEKKKILCRQKVHR